MLSEDLKKEVVKFTVGVAVLGAIMIVVLAILFYKHDDFLSFVLGSLLGCAYVIFNFFCTAVSVKKAADRGDKAKMHMQATYMARMVMLVAVVLVAIYVPFLNVYTTVIPLLFTRIVIFAQSFLLNKKGGKKDEC